jgi:hypothetical protein
MQLALKNGAIFDLKTSVASGSSAADAGCAASEYANTNIGTAIDVRIVCSFDAIISRP